MPHGVALILSQRLIRPLAEDSAAFPPPKSVDGSLTAVRQAPRNLADTSLRARSSVPLTPLRDKILDYVDANKSEGNLFLEAPSPQKMEWLPMALG